MTLTVELKDYDSLDKAEVEVYMDDEGLDKLIDILNRLKKFGGHEHLMTAEWAGAELTSLRQNSQNILINHLCFILKR
ncbi:Imm32 family immunity protein [Candidatus Odyssella thessalonicensis]|uniref:Imm32 family immunity protein n=1 Tax=Candidatus Odyssella thessalonicensis TaxID=84647 RepID=UPI000225ABFE|nr:Imm32 family immunity protein [Candidatus Odyssella thessalonicensis]